VKRATIHDLAKAEIDAAAAWYDRQRTGLGGKFLNAIEEAVARVCNNPQMGSFVRATKFRYVLLHRFPYVLFCSETVVEVHVMAGAHAHRKPGYWKNRKSR
jgi:plasmid stabilization system protein ParE